MVGSLLIMDGEGSTRGYTHQIYDPSLSITSGWIHADPETVGQFIGLKDTNGTEMFNGDIAKITFSEEYHDQNNSIEEGETITGHVHSDGFWTMIGDIYIGNIFYDHAIEIIGNVHDHPELLETP